MKITIFAFLILSSILIADTFYVDAGTGKDSNDGKSAQSAWQTVNKISDLDLEPGDVVLFKRGESWDGQLEINSLSNGDANNPVLIGAYGSGENPVLYELKINGDYVIFENFLIDHRKQAGDCVELSRAENCILRNMEIRNGTSDGIDLDKSHNLLIDNVEIHHFLNGSFSNQQDAHGIVATDTRGITIRNSNIYQNSGDCFQTDPDRDTDTPNDILIENCTLWTGPLAEDFNAGWKTGDVPGENAVDTKLVKENWDAVERMKIVIKNCIAYGWQDGNISNMAAFNMKEKIDAIFDGVTVYDSEIAFRIRGTRGNADVTIMNALVHDCQRAIRAEDDVANLKLYNNTFGSNIETYIYHAGGDGGAGTWEGFNNAFFNNVPQEMPHQSNKIAAADDFLNIDNRDYHLTENSVLIDSGIDIAVVTKDRDGNHRPKGSGYDVGSYEYQSAATLVSSAENPVNNIRLKQNYPNPFNPVTTIEFEIIQTGKTSIQIFNSNGQLVKKLLNEILPKGNYSVKWDATDFSGKALASGVYFYRLSNAEQSLTRRMMLIR